MTIGRLADPTQALCALSPEPDAGSGARGAGLVHPIDIHRAGAPQATALRLMPSRPAPTDCADGLPPSSAATSPYCPRP